MPESVVAAASVVPLSLFAPAQMHHHQCQQQQQQQSRVTHTRPSNSFIQSSSSSSSHSLKRSHSPVADNTSDSDNDNSSEWQRRAVSVRVPSTTSATTTTATHHRSSSESDADNDQDQDHDQDNVSNARTADATAVATHSQTPPSSQSQPQTKKRRRNNVTATIEIRELRDHVQQLERTLESLTHKWRREIRDPATLAAASEAARQKRLTALVETQHASLCELLTTQQLHMAALQSLLPQSPLCAAPSSRALFLALHAPLHLRDDVSDAVRIAQLETRNAAALDTAPSVVDEFTSSYVRDVSSAVPFTRANIAADAAFTYVSTVFIARIPRVSVARVFAAVLSYYAREQHELARRYDVMHEVTPIHACASSRGTYAQLQCTSPTSFTSVSGSTFAARVSGGESGSSGSEEPQAAGDVAAAVVVGDATSGSVDVASTSVAASTTTDTLTATSTTDSANGVVVVDFVDADDRFPLASDPARTRRETSLAVVVSAAVDAASGEPQVLLRQVRVDRFRLASDTATLHAEVRLTQQWSNGDLFMALVCEHLMASASS